MSFSVEFHHMGSFVNDPTLHYDGGQVHVVHNLDVDKWSYFEAMGIVKNEFGYFGNIKMWWKTRESVFENGLKLITLDSHALELAKYALTNKCEVEVYIEHDVSLPDDMVEEVPLLTCNESNAVGAGDSKGKHVCDVVEDIHFDDSKEERVVAPDDGFGSPSQPSTEHGDQCEKTRRKRKSLPSKRLIGYQCEKTRRKRKSVPAKRPIGSRRKLPMRKARKGGTGGVDGDGRESRNDGEIHELQEYNTEELDNGESDSKGDGASKLNYTRFKKEHMSKDFEFKLGMEFGSLQEFKEAIIEHSILNGREIRFQKNDAVRVRVKCKHACDFVAFVSKVANSHTFRMKTLNPKHTCERAFNNKNANSKWVAKVVADKFRSSDNMKVKDIIGEIRSSYATEVTASRARRAKQIVKRMLTTSSQQPQLQGGQPTTDPVKATLRQKKVTAKEQPSTSPKRGKGKVAAKCAKKTQKSHVSTMSQEEGPIDAGLIDHGVSLPGDVVEVPLSTCNKSNIGGGERKRKRNCDVVIDEVVEMSAGSVDVHFDDGKDERVVAHDDGFGNLSQLSTEQGDKCEKTRGKRKSVPAKRPIGSRRKLPLRKARKVGIGGVDGDGGRSGNDGDGGRSGNDGEIHELQVENNTKELDSGGSNSEGDGVSKPNFTRFNKEYMSKDFEFKLGMEFDSLQEFKEAIMEHSILNGREIRFQKNDAVRVRVKCKHGCNFVAFVSKVASSDIFRMKTLDPKHTCERVFNNKNAKSKWVAKVVADKFRSSDKIKVNDIIGEIGSSYATGITASRARRARQMVKRMWTASLQPPHPQGEQPSTDLVKATPDRRPQVSSMSQEGGPIDAGPIEHTEVPQLVEPLRMYIPTW